METVGGSRGFVSHVGTESSFSSCGNLPLHGVLFDFGFLCDDCFDFTGALTVFPSETSASFAFSRIACSLELSFNEGTASL